MELSEGDVLLIAGKGHENYQEINGVKTPFDDYLIVEKSVNNCFSMLYYLFDFLEAQYQFLGQVCFNSYL